MIELMPIDRLFKRQRSLLTLIDNGCQTVQMKWREWFLLILEKKRMTVGEMFLVCGDIGFIFDQ